MYVCLTPSLFLPACLPCCMPACVRACVRACVSACLPACLSACLHLSPPSPGKRHCCQQTEFPWDGDDNWLSEILKTHSLSVFSVDGQTNDVRVHLLGRRMPCIRISGHFKYLQDRDSVCEERERGWERERDNMKTIVTLVKRGRVSGLFENLQQIYNILVLIT